MRTHTQKFIPSFEIDNAICLFLLVSNFASNDRLLIHIDNLYDTKDNLLRELISNTNDAFDKIIFETIRAHSALKKYQNSYCCQLSTHEDTPTNSRKCFRSVARILLACLYFLLRFSRFQPSYGHFKVQQQP